MSCTSSASAGPGITDDDITVTEKVVRRVRGQRNIDLEPTAGQAAWRHAQATAELIIGHDHLAMIIVETCRTPRNTKAPGT